MELIFSITQENRKGEVFLVIFASDKQTGQRISFLDIRKRGELDKTLLELLWQKKSFEEEGRLFISAPHSLAVLEQLILSRKLRWKERSLFFNKLAKAEALLEAESLGEEGVYLTGGILLDGVFHPDSALDLLFPAVPVWGICKQVVFCLPRSTKFSWLSAIQEKGIILTKQEGRRFVEDYLEEPPDGFPRVSWKGEIAKPSDPLPVLPILVLRDNHGAFADLKMCYTDKLIDFLEDIPFLGRNRMDELSFEKDLLETGFIRKKVGSSSYYCPMDQVAKSLSFLWEIGWKIQDNKGRQVLRLTDSRMAVSSERGKIRVQGTFHYEQHQAQLTDVVGSFVRREKFLELSSHAVGWLGEEGGYEGIEELLMTERTKEGCFLPQRQFGLLDGLLNVHVDEETKPLLERLKAKQPLQEEEDPFFQGVLHEYQKEGKQWLLFLQQNGFSGLLADEMGLGKTVQVLSFLSSIQERKPILIVVPTSLVFNWRREWEKFIPHKKLYIHEGPLRKSASLQDQEAIVTSYAYLRIDEGLFSSLDFSVVILDEAQKIKNPESQLAQVAYQLRADMRICLTGTPIENRIDDLWSLFHFLEPELLGERKSFVSSLQLAEADDRYKQQIRKKVRPFIQRRTKEEVALDLPQKIEQVVYVEMNEPQRAFYEKWLSQTRRGLLSKGAHASRMEVLEAILRLRQICDDPALVDGSWAESSKGVSAKVERVVSDLEEMLLQKRKVLVYSQFTKMLGLLKKEAQEQGWNYVYLDGETKDREQVVSSFQEDPDICLFFISLQAGGVGLNLTKADYVILFDPWWNEAVERQAIDRAHRLGREGTVVARRYIIAESVEEKMMGIKSHKTALAKGLMDFEPQEADWSLSEIMELFS